MRGKLAWPPSEEGVPQIPSGVLRFKVCLMRPFPLTWSRRVTQKGTAPEIPPNLSSGGLASMLKPRPRPIPCRTGRLLVSELFSPMDGMAAPRRHHDKMQRGVVGSGRLGEQAPSLAVHSPPAAGEAGFLPHNGHEPLQEDEEEEEAR